jgi:hypothetical protein
VTAPVSGRMRGWGRSGTRLGTDRDGNARRSFRVAEAVAGEPSSAAARGSVECEPNGIIAGASEPIQI